MIADRIKATDSTEIKPGDIVMLKSGGPKMTVARISNSIDTGHVVAECYWSHGTNSYGIGQGDFPPAALTKL